MNEIYPYPLPSCNLRSSGRNGKIGTHKTIKKFICKPEAPIARRILEKEGERC